MNENSSSEFGAFLAGFVIGGLVGAAAALVLAPQSGSEIRSKISGKGHDLADAGSERVHHVRDGADHYLHRSAQAEDDDGFDAQEQARIILDSGKQQAESAVESDDLPAEDDAEAPAES
jgi:gas vesicle protein